MIRSFYKSTDKAFTIVNGDSFDVLPLFEFKFDMIFADPPYFLSNGGISYQAGKVVCVDKGDWDKGGTPESILDFNRKWLMLCREKLKDNGTIWISGTYHNIFTIANLLTELGYKILNVITWVKTNPPPNISCRYFTFSTEFIVWARKCIKVPHKYNYEIMKAINDGKQMTDVWRLPTIGRWEESCGTTGIAANLCGRRFLGIEKEIDFAILSKARREEIDRPGIRQSYIKRLSDLNLLQSIFTNEPFGDYSDLPF